MKRTCKKCKEVKELNDENFIYRKPKNRKGYYMGMCRICHNSKYREYNKVYRKNNPQVNKASTARWQSKNKNHIRKYTKANRIKNKALVSDRVHKIIKESSIPRNKIVIDGDITKIYLSDDIYTVINTTDYEIARGFYWLLNGSGYAYCIVLSNTIHLHRLLTGLKLDDKRVVDHKDMDKLNNTRDNLRVCSTSQNLSNSKMRVSNSSGFKGVSWNKSHEKWQAKITINYKQKFLGLFEDKVEAAEAYDAAAIKYQGEFAMTNKKLGLL